MSSVLIPTLILLYFSQSALLYKHNINRHYLLYTLPRHLSRCHSFNFVIFSHIPCIIESEPPVFRQNSTWTVRQLHGQHLARPSHPTPKAMRTACDWTVPSILTFSYLASRIRYGYSSSSLLLANFSCLPSCDSARELTVAALNPTPQSSSARETRPAHTSPSWSTQGPSRCAGTARTPPC